jgi:glucose/mannose-6-phosphate isomerase
MNLDQPNKFPELDKNQVYESIEAFKDQCLEAWAAASALNFPDSHKNLKNIVICGMGGSRFTPLTIKYLFKSEISVPVEIVDDYELPGYVDQNTLVILSSYSGTTEEVLACARAAKSKGAKLTGVSNGGDVQQLVEDGGIGYFFAPTKNPSGQPRIGSGYMLFGHLGVLYSGGYLKISPEEVTMAINKIDQFSQSYKKDLPQQINPAKKLALALRDHHVFLITSEFLRGFGNGFANQINETAKNISDPRFLPELNHHLLEGLKFPESLHQNGLFVFFTSELYSASIQKRFTITKDVVEKNLVKTLEVHLQGATKLEQVLEAFTLSGFTTYYMAMIADLDPVAIPWVDYFKDQLKS